MLCVKCKLLVSTKAYPREFSGILARTVSQDKCSVVTSQSYINEDVKYK